MKTMVAVPCMDMMHTKFVDSLLQTFRMDPDTEIRFGASSLVYDTRNRLIRKAIDGDFDRVLWIDSDMSFDGAAVAYLNQDLDKGYDFVSGLCFKRKPPFTPAIFKQCDLERLDNGVLIPRAKCYDDYPKDCLFEVAACGFAFMMTSVPGLKRIIDKYGRMLFMPLGGFGEDLSFCIRAKMAGEKLYCDSRTEIGHVGDYVYDARMFERHRKETQR